MKKLRSLIIIGIMACCAILLVACHGPALKTPTGLKVDENVKLLSWLPVDGATGYIIEIKGSGTTEEKKVRVNQLLISYLTPGQYEIKVMAVGDRVNFSNSAWSQVLTVKKLYESGLVYKYINGNTEYALTGIGTYKGDTIVVDSEYRGLPVTEISAAAFNNDYTIKKIEIPDSVTKIGDRAFRNCSELVEVVLPNTITEIGKNAFQNCRKLEKINLPSQLTEIKEYTFHNCRSLTSLTFGSKLKTIGDSAFLKCESLLGVSLDGVETIGSKAFSDCSAMTEFSINSGLKVLGDEAFRKDNNLKTVTLNAELEKIGESVFRDCLSLESIVIPDSVVSIGDYAFCDSEALAEIKIGPGVKTIGLDVFYNTAIWNNTEQGPIYADKWIVGCVTLTDETKDVEIRSGTEGIASMAFYQQPRSIGNNEILYSKLEAIVIPDSVKYINESAFMSCHNLTKAIIGNGVLEIGEYAFAFCDYLMDFAMGENVEVIMDNAFYGCSRLGRTLSNDDISQIKLPKSLRRIGTDAFKKTYIWEKSAQIVYVGTPENIWVVGSNVNTLINPSFDTGSETQKNNIVGISDMAFYQFYLLEKINLPTTLKYIGEGAFYDCMALMEVSIPEEVTVIEDFTFYGCYSLEKVKALSDDENAPLANIKSIGASAFYNCISLYDMAPLTNLEFIGQYAFFDCFYLAEIDMGNKLEVIEPRAFSSSGISRITIPGSVKEIPDYAFWKCELLQEVTLGDGVERIGKYAFSGCSWLYTVNFADSLTVIDDYAFRHCFSLSTLLFNDNLKTIGKGAFASSGVEHVVFPEKLESIGDQAFMNCYALKSVLLNDKIGYIGMHVFYGCKGLTDEDEEYVEDYVGLTIYINAESIPNGWSMHWNSGKRPVLLNCVYKDGYVESFKKTEDSIANYNKSSITIAKPQRDGYKFLGWATSPDGDVVYSEGQIDEVADETVLYSKWEKIAD